MAMPRILPSLLTSCILLIYSGGLAAQELTPRAYWPAPQGTEILSLGASYTKGDTVPDPSLPLTGIDSNITTYLVGYTRFLDLWGRTASLLVQQPYSSGETTGNFESFGKLRSDYSGIGDFSATVSVNLMGAPAMDRKAFAELRRNPHPILGASLRVVAPSGEYHNDKLVNVGTNRWAGKAELGYIMVLHPQWLLELEAGAWFFQDNDDFLGIKREQEPVFATQAHLIRRFSDGFWGGIDVNAYRGGRSTLGGRKLDDLQRDSRLGGTLVIPFAGKHAIKLSYAWGSANNSDERFDIYQLSYQRLL